MAAFTGGGGGGNNNAGVNSTGPTSLGLPAGNPFFNNNAGGTNSAFQSAAGMLQGGGHAFFTPQQQPQQGPQPGQGQQQVPPPFLTLLRVCISVFCISSITFASVLWVASKL